MIGEEDNILKPLRIWFMVVAEKLSKPFRKNDVNGTMFGVENMGRETNCDVISTSFLSRGYLGVSFLFRMAGMGQDDTVDGTMEAKINRHDRVIKTYLDHKSAGLKTNRICEKKFINRPSGFPLVWRKIDTM